MGVGNSMVEHVKQYLVIMMHALHPREDDKAFYEQLYAALKDPVIAMVHHQDSMPGKDLRHMLEDIVGTQKDVVSMLVYFDSGFGEDLLVDLYELVRIASIASIVTGNVADTTTYDFDARKSDIVYTFS